MTHPLRKTTQHLIPVNHSPTGAGTYDIYPSHPLGQGKIATGYALLASRLAQSSIVIIDGYVGIDWEDVRARLDHEFSCARHSVAWTHIDSALLGEAEIETLVSPFLGGDDPIFGTRFTGTLANFFDAARLKALTPASASPISIIYGCGAALAGWRGLNVYIDLPKNEIQFRSRAGHVRNLGTARPREPKPQYKRFYFVDWVVLNAHKKELLPTIDVMVDGQRHDTPVFCEGADLRDALGRLSHSVFRVRPWFEPGPWGGQWIREKIPGLSPNVPNYAWSFELIVPENGILFESDGTLLEVSFDVLMFHDREAILGPYAQRFGDEFPIRFDFLDTFDGGNLSVQCHPRPEYARKHFGETFTQDETYYILDCGDDAEVYLGFNEDINPEEFATELRRSFNDATPFDVRRFVNMEKARKHDLFLIPNGTIHCSGINNLVLEISATPYIFTFKMYDWQRLDLDGRPRPLNIDRALENLYFDRKGERIQREFVSKPNVIERGPGSEVVHVPTHADHFYDVYRFDISTELVRETKGSPQVMSLVEGTVVTVETPDGTRRTFNYAETFVVPAGAGSYKLIATDGPVKVVMSFLKPEARRG